MVTNIISSKTKTGLLPTIKMPENLPPVSLSENSLKVFINRYVRKDYQGNPVEKPEDTFWRVAYHIALAEETWGNDSQETAIDYYNLMSSKRFFPNSPTFTGAGTPLGQLAACFVLPINDDMGKTGAGIFETLRNAALIQQTGGGNGFSFSKLRPSNSPVKASSGKATGPVGFLHVYDQAFGEIAQGGTRRGANMAVLRVDHPDIVDFINCKTDEKAVTNFNISVGITDKFMDAVKNNEDWDLKFIDVTDPRYKTFFGTLDEAEKAGIPILVHETVKASELFDKIVKQAHHNGEPGILFIDTANKANPVPHLYSLEATNPCGEQWLGPYENCCLGSVNLAEHANEDGTLNWKLLGESAQLATRFLDDVIEMNAYVPAVPQLEESAHNTRRIGLGIMGLGDILYSQQIRYGSKIAQEFSGQVIEFIRFKSMEESIRLAKARGAFPKIKGSIYDPAELQWTPPEPIFPYETDFNRPAIDWESITSGIKEHGIRNSAQTTIAPTGTIGTVAGCEGYGCEPVFALAYNRTVNQKGADIKLSYVSPLFSNALEGTDLSDRSKKEIINKITESGSCQDIEELPQEIRDSFVVSSEISAREHVMMQAAMQAFVDNSLSKTINFSSDASEEDISEAYKLAWEMKCKGLTVYVTGSREKEVLELNSKKKEEVTKEAPHIWNQSKKPRPRMLNGYTFNTDTPVGKAFITINENGGKQPFEIFLTTAKAGSEIAAVSEALGRLMSYTLRLSSPVAPRSRLQEIYRQIKGIGGSRPYGYGPNRVSSLPDGVAKVIGEYIEVTKENFSASQSQEIKPTFNNAQPASANIDSGEKIGDICPDCGYASVINEEGCRKCYDCGYSEC
jgi:ribonucleoside-diphosphate reductase alpha chain